MAEDKCCKDTVEYLLDKEQSSKLDKFILKFRKKRIFELITQCQSANCKQEELNEILEIYVEEFKSKLKGHFFFTSVFIFTGVGVSFAQEKLPGISDQLQVLMIVLYHGFSSALLNKKYAQLAQWGYKLKSGRAARISKGDGKELSEVYNHLRHNYDLTEEEARDSLARALGSITPALLSLNLEKDKSTISSLNQVIATSLVNLRILHRQIEPDQPSFIRTIRGHLQDYANDSQFRHELLENIKKEDPSYIENLKYYDVLFSKVFSQSKEELQEFYLLRDILRNSHEEIDFDRWYGETTGLSQAVSEYIRLAEVNAPLNPDELSRLKMKFKKVVSYRELNRLGWSYDRAKEFSSLKLSRLKSYEHPSRKRIEKEPDVISIKKSIKRNIRR